MRLQPSLLSPKHAVPIQGAVQLEWIDSVGAWSNW